jgi:hypothetical protein
MFLLVVLLFSGTVVGQSTANYVFTSSNDGSLIDMSTGTTTILTPSSTSGDFSSPVTNIGFPFVFMGVPHNQFSVNSNGLMRLGSAVVSTAYSNNLNTTTDMPHISAFWDDLNAVSGLTSKIHTKLIGTEPNRTLVVEWKDFVLVYNASVAAPASSWQILLSESGKIEYRYGNMLISGGGTVTASIGFGVAAADNKVLSLTNIATPAVTTLTGSVVNNLINSAAVGPIVGLNSTSDGNRVVYSFTPPTAPLAPTELTFSGIAPSGLTLNWVDNANNESGYAIYRSIDGTNYTLIATTAADATSYAATGLLVETNYFWRVAAVNEGAVSSFISGSQATAPAGEITSIATGNWSETTTWSTGAVPTATDNVTITAGHTVTVNAAGVFNNLTVDGTLAFQAFTIAGGQATVSATGIVNIASGTIGTLSITRNVTNNGVMDFWASGTQYGKILFTGTNAQTFTCGAASTTNIGNVEVVKTAIGNVADIITDGTFTIRSGAAAGFLTLTSGTFKISGTATVSNPVFLSAAYSIASTAGFWLNNPNFTVSGQAGSPTMSGLLRISNGTFNIGTTNNSMGFSSNSTVIIEGGVVNAVGRFGVGSAANNVTYTQTGGVVNVSTMAAGNASTTLASFDLGTATTTVFNLSGGSIVVQKVCSGATGPGDYRGPVVGTYPTLNPNVNITGGALQFGHSSSPASAQNFRIQGYAPATSVNNETANHNLILAANTYLNGNFNTGAGTITLATGTTGYRLYAKGASFVNNGTIIATAALSRLWFLGTTPQTLSGTGTITAPIAGMYIDNPTSVTIDPSASNFAVNYIFLYRGVLINSNKLTIGNGGTTDPWIVRGGLATAIAGSFDQAPSFNVGSGGLEVDYAVASAPISTGFELSYPADVLVMQTNVDVTLSQPYSVGSFGFAATNSGKFITANDKLLTITGTLPTSINSVAGNTGYVQGPLARTLPASLTGTLTYAFPIGKGASNLFELVNPITTADGPVVVKAEVFDAATGGTAGAGIQAGSLGNRYWNAEIVSGATNFTNTSVKVTQVTPALVAENALAQSGTQTGSYVLASTNPPVGNTLLSNTITGLGYFAIGIKELPQSYASSTTTQSVTTPVLQGDVNQLIIGVQVVASGNFSPLTVSNIDFSTNGTTNVADIANAKLYYTGTTATFATTTQVGATIATPGATFSINPAQALADGTNYFWLVYDIAADATNMNVVDAECTSVTVGGTPYSPTETAPVGSRTIRARLAGTYLVGVGGDYTTITAALTDLNALGVKGSVVFALTDANYSTAETFPLTVNAIINSSEANFVLIKPAPGVSPVITGNSTNPIFVVNASYFGIDGSNVIDGTTRDLTIINNGTGASSGIVFSTNVGTYLSYKNFIGIGGLSTAGFGIVLNGVTMAEVKNCKISKTAIGIQAQANCNQVLFEGNEIGATVATDKIHTSGIVAFNTNNFAIKNNTISGVSSTTSATASAIVVTGTSSLGQVSGNIVRDIKNTNSTGWGSNGIWLNSSNTNAQVLIFNNIITDIASVGYSGWGTGDNGYGIIIGAGGGYGIYYNTIRLTTDQTATSGGNTAGINILSAVSTANSLDIRNNIITSSQTKGTRYAVYSAATNAVFAHINNNNYFAPTGVGYLGSACATLAAWQTATGKDVNSLNVMPYFTSATDFSLVANMNCALDGFAAPLAQVTIDFLGADRDATNPDMGAIEFTSVPLAAPVANNEEICAGGAIPSLVATTVGTAKWYSEEALNTLVFTGNTFATGNTDAGEYTYYVTDTYGTCVSSASMVTLSIYLTPAQPELPVGPITAISNEVSDFSVTAVVGATSYEWFLTPAEAGVLTPDGATASIAWNINFAGTASLSVQAHNVNCSSAVSDILEIEVSLAQFNLTLVADPIEGGSVIGDGTFDVGASIEISATPAIGYEFISWTNEASEVVSSSAIYAFEMPAASITLTANFQQVAYSLTLMVNPVEGGEVSGDGLYFYEEAANITATANAGYKFVNWTDEDDYVVSSLPNFEFSMPAADVTLTANFEAVYTVTFNVVDEDSNPIDDAVVTLNGTAYPAGQYVITDLGVGYYTYFVSKEAYITESGNFTLVDQDEVVNVTLTLGTNPTYTVTFTVVDEGSAPITDAIITFNGVAASAGEYVFTNVEAGAYEFSVAREGFVTIEDVATVVDEDITIPITLIHVGINSNTLSNLSAYPNPFSNQITLSNPSLVSRVVVANLIGQVVMDIRTNGLATLETASLSAGVYLITFEAANGDRLVRKMVKK